MRTIKPLALDPVAEARRQWAAHGWEDAALGLATVSSIMRVQQILMGRVAEALKPYRLSFARYELLMLLSFSKGGALPLSSISRRLQAHPASVTNIVDRLAGQEYLVREAHATDRRSFMARITPAGRKIAQQATKAVNKKVYSNPGIDDESAEALIAILTTLRRDAGDFLP